MRKFFFHKNEKHVLNHNINLMYAKISKPIYINHCQYIIFYVSIDGIISVCFIIVIIIFLSCHIAISSFLVN